MSSPRHANTRPLPSELRPQRSGDGPRQGVLSSDPDDIFGKIYSSLEMAEKCARRMTGRETKERKRDESSSVQT